MDSKVPGVYELLFEYSDATGKTDTKNQQDTCGAKTQSEDPHSCCHSGSGSCCDSGAGSDERSDADQHS